MHIKCGDTDEVRPTGFTRFSNIEQTFSPSQIYEVWNNTLSSSYDINSSTESNNLEENKKKDNSYEYTSDSSELYNYPNSLSPINYSVEEVSIYDYANTLSTTTMTTRLQQQTTSTKQLATKRPFASMISNRPTYMNGISTMRPEKMLLNLVKSSIAKYATDPNWVANARKENLLDYFKKTTDRKYELSRENWQKLAKIRMEIKSKSTREKSTTTKTTKSTSTSTTKRTTLSTSTSTTLQTTTKL